jgi:hypothetical protein
LVPGEGVNSNCELEQELAIRKRLIDTVTMKKLNKPLLVTIQVKRFLKQLNGALFRNEGRGLINFLLRMLILVPFRSSKS